MRVLQAETKRPLDLLTVGTGGRVAAASSAFGVRGDADVWDVATGKVLKILAEPDGPATALGFLPDGRFLLKSAGGYGVSVWRVDDWFGTPWPDFPDPAKHLRMHAAEFAADAGGTCVLVTDQQPGFGRLSFWSLPAADPTAARNLWLHESFSALYYRRPAVSPDGSRVAVAEHEWFRDRPANTLQIRNAVTGKVLSEVEFGASDPLEQIVFSADGAKVLARSSGRTVKVFDAATGQAAGELLHPGRPFVTGVAVHPDGTVACCRNNGAVCLWNLEKRELVRTLDWKLGKLVSVAFSPDGSIDAAGTEDGQVVVWDVD